MFKRIFSQASVSVKSALLTSSRMSISIMSKPLIVANSVSKFQTLPACMMLNKPTIFSNSVQAFHIKKKTNRRKTTKPYKLKTHRASAKRFWVSGSGKIMRMTRGKRHRMRNKSNGQLRRLSQKVEVPKALRKRYQKSMPYLF